MRILIVASDFPWPKIQGGHLRLSKTIEALAQLGTTDLFAPYDYRRSVPTLPSNVEVERLATMARRGSPHQLRWRVAWLTRRGIPLEVVMQRMDMVSRPEFESWVADRYDLVWFDRAAMFECTGRPILGPTIVDFHDLEDEKARSRARILRAGLSQRRGSAWLHEALTVAQTRLNARDWRQFQRSVASDVDRVRPLQRPGRASLRSAQCRRRPQYL